MSATEAALPSEEPLTCRAADIEQRFPALHLTRSSRNARRMGRFLLVLLILTVIAAFFAPWQQSIRGEGWVVAFDPYERPQAVKSQVKGLVAERGDEVYENAFVEEGQLLFSVVNQDPDYLGVLQQQVSNTANGLDIAQTRLATAETLLDNYKRVVNFANDEINDLGSARDELIEAYDRFVDQAQNKLDAEKNKLDAAKAKLKQAKLDYERKKNLFAEGLMSELKMQESEQKFRDAEAYLRVAEDQVRNAENGVRGKEKERESKRQEWSAKIQKVSQEKEKAIAGVSEQNIKIKKIGEEIQLKRSKLLEFESKTRAQQQQEIKAPISGYIMDLAVFDGMPVKLGDELCRIVPKTENPAVQVWVAGNDAPLIHKGDHVRLQFEGWPAVQFSGWPSVAIGTFGGEVALVDPTDNKKGQFRVLIRPHIDPEGRSPEWPEYPYLRQGVRANAWVLLDQVALGYEVWRRMNGFPPSLDNKDEVKGKTPKPPKIKI